jgi:hypothetical protein
LTKQPPGFFFARFAQTAIQGSAIRQLKRQQTFNLITALERQHHGILQLVGPNYFLCVLQGKAHLQALMWLNEFF